MTVAVELRDIVTDADRAAVLALRRGPGQERYLGSMASHFEDAVADAHARPRMWSVHDGASGQLVGFVMISDDIPAETLAADDEIVGPYFLWRLLIDHRFQGQTNWMDLRLDQAFQVPGVPCCPDTPILGSDPDLEICAVDPSFNPDACA